LPRAGQGRLSKIEHLPPGQQDDALDQIGEPLQRVGPLVAVAMPIAEWDGGSPNVRVGVSRS